MHGSIVEPDTVVLTPIDILLMDRGSSAHTQYEIDEEVTDFIMHNQYFHLKIGHIHSHNTMRVFFSGEDLSELSDNLFNHNFYFSLVVNNFMEMDAKVAVGALSNANYEESFLARAESGTKYTIQTNKRTIENKSMFVYDCNIVKPNVEITVPQSFIDRYELIIDRCIKRDTAPKIQPVSNNYHNRNGSGYMIPQPTNSNLTPNSPSKQWTAPEFTKPTLPNTTMKSNPLSFVDDASDYNDELLEFVYSLLYLGKTPTTEITLFDIETAIDDIDINGVVVNYDKHVVDSFGTVYSDTYINDENDNDMFMSTLSSVIEVLEEFEGETIFCSKLCTRLRIFQQHCATIFLNHGR